jgi:hypothetical protein
MNALIFSDDSFLVDSLRERFATDLTLRSCLTSDSSSPIDEDILLFDQMSDDLIREKTEGLCINNKLILSIGHSQVKNVTNLIPPFRIANLFYRIEWFISYVRNNIFFHPFGTINFNENTIVKNGILIKLTEKEMELIRKLMVRRSTKDELLRDIWNIKVVPSVDNRVVETTVYDIKQKLSSYAMEDFIKYSDGYYQIE